ncbi:DgyrCDS1747 [Dimorphilus gyrociliatus]|uniref:DgyrCDS1747 n=1 Tax=Dimorphilus gyrociliatus TaxID=2664684 RepID=A0A7I8VA41_9ANNE|nr:DgyrCDS1747 [Dimorphilus gyrociliatus]
MSSPSAANWQSSDTEVKQDDDAGSETNADSDMSNDAEGVWSADIEQSFQEALAIYPPCGRRKIILSDEGKMYGRNELIARYIKLRTGKTRTRKQVSSHIQVLARRKSKEIQSQLKDVTSKEKALQQLSSMSSAQIVSASAMQNKNNQPPPTPAESSNRFENQSSAPDHTMQQLKALSSAQIVSAAKSGAPTIGLYGASAYWQQSAMDVKPGLSPPYNSSNIYNQALQNEKTNDSLPAWQGRSIAGPRLRLVEFSAFQENRETNENYSKHLFIHISNNYSFNDPTLEAVDVRQIYDKFPEKKGGLKELHDKGPQTAFFLVKFWADLNTNVTEGAFYGVSSQYESSENMTIQCSTKVCSFGKQVVEKVETEHGRFESGRYVYRISRSPMCDYMINFIQKLKQLPEKYMMNSVLENFTILQVVTNRDTQETLLCMAFVFEVSTSMHGAQHHIYRLVKD